VFTDIAKYSLDRDKGSLADSLIELDTNPDRKIMVYLLMLSASKDKHIVDKLLNAAEECTRSSLIFRVVQELIEAEYVQNHAWVNILYQKPNVSRHYIRYLKNHKREDLLKNYYLQNKNLEGLGFYLVELLLKPNIESELPTPMPLAYNS
jgi:hypothetical protein